MEGDRYAGGKIRGHVGKPKIFTPTNQQGRIDILYQCQGYCIAKVRRSVQQPAKIGGTKGKGETHPSTIKKINNVTDLCLFRVDWHDSKNGNIVQTVESIRIGKGGGYTAGVRTGIELYQRLAYEQNKQH